MSATVNASIQLVLGFDQIWNLVQQLSDTKQVELLHKLQEKLEKGETASVPVQDTQKIPYESGITPTQLAQKTPLINYFSVEEEAAADDGKEMTEEEFH